MPRSTSPSDPSGEPRDNTVDLPRLDVGGLANIVRGATLPEQEPADLLEPLPEQEPGPAQWSLEAPEPRGYPTSRPAPSGSLSHPYADPDELAQPTSWRAFEPTAPAENPRPASNPHPGMPAPAQPAAAQPAAAQPAAAQPAAAQPAAAQPAAVQPAAVQPTPVEPTPVRRTEAAPPAVVRASVAPVPAPDPSAASLNVGAASPQATEAAGEPPAELPSAPAAPPPTSAPPASPVASSPSPVAPAPSRQPADRAAQGRAAAVSPAVRAPAGSLADLRSRLARLPDGHPSSAYEDDGRAKPLPIRLKQLELGLPARSRELAGSFLPDTDAEDVGLLERKRDAPEAELPEPARSAPEVALPEQGEADAGEPEVRADVPEPEAPAAGADDDPAAELDADSAEVAGSSPAPPEWSNPYASAGNGRVTLRSDAAGPPAELTLGQWQATPSPRVSGLEDLTRRGGNGHGPGNGRGDGSPRRKTVVRPKRPLAPTGDADRQTKELSPDRPHAAASDADRRDTAQYRIAEPPTADLRDLVEQAMASARKAEGRSVYGSYGSSGLTPAMQRLAAQLPFGGLAPDSEACSLKSPERFTAKLTRLIARNPGRTAEELAATIGDMVRYAFVFEAADYVEGTWLVHRRLKSRGFELEIRRNRWESPDYKGIFTQWRDPAHHLPFEVQFHSTASWAVVQRTHHAYVQITDPATPPAERARLRARQVAAAATAKSPPNWTEIDDFRLEAR